MSRRDGEVLILTGPPGWVKTTAARLLSTRRARSVHLESDLFWRFITSGYIEPWNGRRTIEHLRHFFFQRHAAHQIVNPLFE